MSYIVNRTWSDRFLPDIKNIVVGHLLEVATDPFDMQQATDLMMLPTSGGRDTRISIPTSSPSAQGSLQGLRPSYPR